MLLSFICLGLIMAVSIGAAKLPVFKAQPSKLVAALLSLASVVVGLLIGIVGFELILHAMGMTITGIRPVFVLALVIGLPMAYIAFSNVRIREKRTESEQKTPSRAKIWLRNGLVRVWVFVSALCVVGFGIQLTIDLKERNEDRSFYKFELNIYLENKSREEKESEKLEPLKELEYRYRFTFKKRPPDELMKQIDEITSKKQLYRDLATSHKGLLEDFRNSDQGYNRRIEYGQILIWGFPLGLGVLLFGINWILAGFKKEPVLSVDKQPQDSSNP